MINQAPTFTKKWLQETADTKLSEPLESMSPLEVA